MKGQTHKVHHTNSLSLSVSLTKPNHTVSNLITQIQIRPHPKTVSNNSETARVGELEREKRDALWIGDITLIRPHDAPRGSDWRGRSGDDHALKQHHLQNTVYIRASWFHRAAALQADSSTTWTDCMQLFASFGCSLQHPVSKTNHENNGCGKETQSKQLNIFF